jgi:hypothetical protein
MGGKHHAGAVRRWTPAAVVITLLVLLGSGVAWAVVGGLPGDDTPSGSASRAAATTPAPPASGPAGADGTASTVPAGTSGAPGGSAARALSVCREAVAAREEVVRAASASARDWRLHTDAQRRLDDGAWTVARTRQVWAASKARGAADLQRFAAAAERATAADAVGACRSVVRDTAGTDLTAAAERCLARDRALAAVVSAGTVVNGQWAAHVAMMADKAHTDAAAYHDRWVSMVREAGEPLRRYDVAVTALRRAPECPG